MRCPKTDATFPLPGSSIILRIDYPLDTESETRREVWSLISVADKVLVRRSNFSKVRAECACHVREVQVLLSIPVRSCVRV